MLGHLKDGVTPEQAAADVNSIGAWVEKTYPKEVAVTYNLGRPTFNGDFLGRPVKAFVGGLMLLAGLILLAACANLGSLFAARAADRGREVALRLALEQPRPHPAPAPHRSRDHFAHGRRRSDWRAASCCCAG